MRQIGSIPDGELAEQFADFLRGQGTACSLDSVENGWAVWIHDEDRLAAAKTELQRFLSDPEHERYRQAREQAAAKIREQYERQKSIRRNTISLQKRWNAPTGDRCPLTVGLLAICAVVAYFTRLGGEFFLSAEESYENILPLLQQLWISPDGTWHAILSGEVWRIWTPIFIHYGWMHILFNGLWLKDFGMLLEDRLGTARFLFLVLIIGAISNLLQFEFGSFHFWHVLTTLRIPSDWPLNSHFGGMSGVNYGLFGYLWMRGKLDPESGLGVSQQIVTLMIVWFLVCFTGLVGPIANMAHAGGLAAGVGLGAWAAIRHR